MEKQQIKREKKKKISKNLSFKTKGNKFCGSCKPHILINCAKNPRGSHKLIKLRRKKSEKQPKGQQFVKDSHYGSKHFVAYVKGSFIEWGIVF